MEKLNNSLDGSVAAFNSAVKQWIKENFAGSWQPSVEVVKSQLLDLYKIDNVNQFNEISEKGGLSLLVNEYYDALNSALNEVDKGKLSGRLEDV